MPRKQRHDPQLREQLKVAFWNPEDTKPTGVPSSREGRIAYERDQLSLQIMTAVEAEMKVQDLNQGELAARMGVSEGRVSQILSGGQNLTLQTLAALAEALGSNFELRLLSPVAIDERAKRDARVPLDR